MFFNPYPVLIKEFFDHGFRGPQRSTDKERTVRFDD
jgi:hypothetical protein